MKILLILMISLSAYAEDWDQATIDEGKRLLKVMGCNDCHTPGYFERNGEGELPIESETGGAVFQRGIIY